MLPVLQGIFLKKKEMENIDPHHMCQALWRMQAKVAKLTVEDCGMVRYATKEKKMVETWRLLWSYVES